MADSDLELDHDESLSKSHSNLLDTVSKLDLKQRIKKAVISEPSFEVSEFHLAKSGIANKSIVNITDLAKNLGKTAAQNKIKKQVLNLRSKSKTLPKPLEKPVADRIKRSVGYEKTKKALDKWNGIVARNRTISHITFPLSVPGISKDPQYEISSRCTIKSDLQREFEKLEAPKETQIVDEKQEGYKLTRKELTEKSREAARLRAQMSYKAAKARRQNKIKSKKFHRIQRKQKLKADIKEFEELQKTDPEAALEKLQMLDKVRAKERMSLRHKNTGQWAKNLQVRAKYDKESRQALAQQLAISRELTQKLQKATSSDEENDDQVVPPSFCPTAEDKDNPWMNKVKTTQEIDDFLSNYRKYWDGKKNTAQNQDVDEKADGEENDQPKDNPVPVKMSQALNPVESVIVIENAKDSEKSKKKTAGKKGSKQKAVKKIKEKKVRKEKLEVSGTSTWLVDSEDNNEDVLDELFDNADKHVEKRVNKKIKNMQEKASVAKKVKPAKRKRKLSDEDELAKLGLKPNRLRAELNEPLLETVNGRSVVSNDETIETELRPELEKKKKDEEISADSFVQVEPQFIESELPTSNLNEALDDSDDEEDQNQIISEAFQDDDAVQDFKKEKEKEIQKDQPKDLDLTLPGWGSWGGKNIKIPARKRAKFLIKRPKKEKRKDENKGNVIIIEEEEAKIQKHLVNEVPFPFKSVGDFEASLRTQLGRDFVPEKLHQQLIAPPVKTKMGSIIEPMDEDVLVKKVNKKKRKLL